MGWSYWTLGRASARAYGGHVMRGDACKSGMPAKDAWCRLQSSASRWHLAILDQVQRDGARCGAFACRLAMLACVLSQWLAVSASRHQCRSVHQW
jgi:hypothetical protein